MPSENLIASESILGNRDLFADRIVSRYSTLQPELVSRYGNAGRAKCVNDVRYHLNGLAEAISAGRPQLFVDYVAWLKVMLCARGIPIEDLAESLKLCCQIIKEELPYSQAILAEQCILASLDRLPTLPSEAPSYLTEDRPLASLAREYLNALLAADRRKASELVMDAIQQGTSVRDIYLHVFQQSQYEVGRLWQSNQISIAQEHLCTAATQLIMSQLYPLIFKSERINRRIVTVCIGGDLHEIGIRMVADLFEMAGWDTFYLGADVPSASIIQTAIDRDAHVLAVSTALTTNVSSVAKLITEVRSNRACDHMIILVGGHPFKVSLDLWREIGADGHAADADQAIELAEQLLSSRKPAHEQSQ